MSEVIPFDAVMPATPGKPEKPESAQKGTIPFDQVLPITAKPEPAPKKEMGFMERMNENFRKGAISDENKRLTGVQFTSQSPSKEHYVGPAIKGTDLTGDEKDDTFYLRDEKGNYSAADKKKHLILRDPESGDFGIYNRDPTKNYGPITGRLVGLGNLVQEGFQSAPTRLPSMAGAATRGQEALLAARGVEESTGVKVPVPQNFVTESNVSPVLAKTAEAIPGGGAPFENAAARMEGGVETAANRASEINTGNRAPSVETAGNTAREGIEAYAAPKTGILAKRVSEAYDKLDAHIPSDVSKPLDNTLKMAQDLQSRFEATGQEGINPTIQKILGAATDPKGVTYQGLKDLRSAVGEMLESGTKISETGISDKELKGLYKSLSDDMRAMVSEHGGPRGLQLWERANTMAKLASERRETLGKILGTNRSDEGIFNAILRMAGGTSSADAKTLAAAKRAIPADEWNEIASTVVKRLGRVQGSKDVEHFDVGKFVGDYSKLSERGKSLLFGDNQRLRKALDNIAKLATFDEPVKHPGPVAHLLTAGAVMGHASGGEGWAGKVGHVLHLASGILGVRALGNMLSKPATAESVAKWMEGYKLATLKPTKGNVMLFSRASDALANNAAKEDRENIGAAGSTAVDWGKKLFTILSPMSSPNK